MDAACVLRLSPRLLFRQGGSLRGRYCPRRRRRQELHENQTQLLFPSIRPTLLERPGGYLPTSWNPPCSTSDPYWDLPKQKEKWQRAGFEQGSSCRMGTEPKVYDLVRTSGHSRRKKRVLSIIGAGVNCTPNGHVMTDLPLSSSSGRMCLGQALDVVMELIQGSYEARYRRG